MDAEKEREFLEMTESCKGIIYKICLMYSEDSEGHNDLFQEVVLNLWGSFARFRGESTYSTWVYRVALNTCISTLRKNKIKNLCVPFDVKMDLSQEESNDIKELYRMINLLNPIEKAIIILYLDEKSYDEIATIMGITRTNVAVRIHRIKDRLREISKQ